MRALVVLGAHAPDGRRVAALATRRGWHVHGVLPHGVPPRLREPPPPLRCASMSSMAELLGARPETDVLICVASACTPAAMDAAVGACRPRVVVVLEGSEGGPSRAAAWGWGGFPLAHSPLYAEVRRGTCRVFEKQSVSH